MGTLKRLKKKVRNTLEGTEGTREETRRRADEHVGLLERQREQERQIM
jgi:hypothetical protein